MSIATAKETPERKSYLTSPALIEGISKSVGKRQDTVITAAAAVITARRVETDIESLV